MKIRFCENNKGSGKAFKRLKENFPEHNVKRKDCRKRCDICHKTPFAIVDGETIQADDGEELYAKVAALLSKP